MIRLILPTQLADLAGTEREVKLDINGPVTQRSVIDALEARYSVLAGTIRDHGTKRRRPFIRYYACQEDLSLEPPDEELPEAVATGREPFIVMTAIAGG